MFVSFFSEAVILFVKSKVCVRLPFQAYTTVLSRKYVYLKFIWPILAIIKLIYTKQNVCINW